MHMQAKPSWCFLRNSHLARLETRATVTPQQAAPVLFACRAPECMGTSTIPSLAFSRTLDKELGKRVPRACSLSATRLQRVPKETFISKA